LSEKDRGALQVHELILERFSPRAFDAHREIGVETLQVLLEAARWAPSAANSQPWFYLVFDGSDVKCREAARALLDEGNRVWAQKAPVLLLACTRLVRENGKPQRYGEHDLGLANQNLLLQAFSMGLYAHPMAGFDKHRAREAFGIPETHQPLVMIAVGYPGSEAQLPDAVQQKEGRPRQRKPTGEIAAWWHWPEGFRRGS